MHLSAGDEGAMVVPASAEVVESVSVWVVVVGPVGGVVAVPSVVEVSVPPSLRISLGLTLLNLDFLSSGSWGNNASKGAGDSDSHVVLAAGGGGVDQGDVVGHGGGGVGDVGDLGDGVGVGVGQGVGVGIGPSSIDQRDHGLGCLGLLGITLLHGLLLSLDSWDIGGVVGSPWGGVGRVGPGVAIGQGHDLLLSILSGLLSSLDDREAVVGIGPSSVVVGGVVVATVQQVGIGFGLGL